MYISQANSDNIVKAIRRLNPQAGQAVMILLGEKEMPDITGLISSLNEQDIDFFGGVFPGLIYDDRKYESGAIIKVLPIQAKPFLVQGLDRRDFEMPDFSATIRHGATAMILVDGLTTNIALFLSEMFNQLGNSVRYLGGGAGFISLERKPCVFTPEGCFQDAAVVGVIDLESAVGVRHGWRKIMGPLVATKTRMNVIVELNWRNALEVYREIVEGDSGERITSENFFDVTKGYPFGIYKAEAEDVVRDPIVFNDKGELTCVGEVPENVVLNVLKGDSRSLIDAAGEAVNVNEALKHTRVQHTLVVDCISRVLFLEEGFAKELEAVKQRVDSIGQDSIPEGILTLGEISSSGDGFVEFFNKTIVVGVLYES